MYTLILNILLAAAPLAQSTAYVNNRGARTLDIVDLTGQHLVDRVFLGGNEQTGIAVTPNGATAVALSRLTNQAFVVDLTGRQIVNTLAIGDSPTFALITPDGTRAYISHGWETFVSVIDLGTLNVSTVDVQQSTNWLAMSPSGDRLYAAGCDYAGCSVTDRVAVLDTDPGSGGYHTLIDAFSMGGNPTGMAVSPDESRVYIADKGTNRLLAFETAGHTLLHFAGVGNLPQGVAVRPDGSRIYVANREDDLVLVIDAVSFGLFAQTSVADGPVMIRMKQNGKRAYVTSRFDPLGILSVIDTDPSSAAYHNVIDEIVLGGEPLGLGLALGPRLPGIPYCHGLGTCRCNNGDPFAGCATSQGRGAVLYGDGSASVGADDLLLIARDVPPNQSGILFLANNSNDLPFGDGKLCATGGIVRLGLQNSGTDGVLMEGPGLASSQGIVAGQTRYFQACRNVLIGRNAGTRVSPPIPALPSATTPARTGPPTPAQRWWAATR